MTTIFLNHRFVAVLLCLVVFGTLFIITNGSPPATLLLAVPFTDQAPTGKWDRNEDCEEASIAMAQAYLTGDTEDRLPASGAQAYISKLRSWEETYIGYNADTGAYATSRMAEGAFNINVRQIRDYSETDLKRELAKHNVILLPINARLLGNPTYAHSGPTYHMIVVRGYNASGFIVNDPGTEQGNGQVYSFDTLIKSAADWNNSAKIMDPTIKIALILSK